MSSSSQGPAAAWLNCTDVALTAQQYAGESCQPEYKRGNSEIWDGGVIKLLGSTKGSMTVQGMQRESRAESKKGTTESLGKEERREPEILKKPQGKSLVMKQKSIFQIKEVQEATWGK